MRTTKDSAFARAIGALVLVAVAATIARMVYHALHWRDLMDTA